VDRVAVVVKDLRKAIELYSTLFNLEFDVVEERMNDLEAAVEAFRSHGLEPVERMQHGSLTRATWRPPGSWPGRRA
jgi:predicted enzyme related to lactoylglutathione lyase